MNMKFLSILLQKDIQMKSLKKELRQLLHVTEGNGLKKILHAGEKEGNLGIQYVLSSGKKECLQL